MEQNESAAKTNWESSQEVGNDAAADKVTESIDTEFSDGAVASVTEQPQKPFKNEQNAAAAKRRREQEMARVRERAVIEAIGGLNPFTGEEVKDSADVEEYLLMRKIESEGGDPLSDFSRHHKAQEKQRAAEAEQENARREWYANDRESFVKRYPDVDLNALVADQAFGMFAEGKVGEMPLAEIYESFTRLMSTYEKKAKNMAAQYYANSKASPGSLSSPDVAGSDFISKEAAQRMSREEIKSNYEKIRASMSKW